MKLKETSPKMKPSTFSPWRPVISTNVFWGKQKEALLILFLVFLCLLYTLCHNYVKGRGRRNPRERPRPISGRAFDRMTKLFFTSKRERGRDLCVSVIVNASAGVIMMVSAIVSVIMNIVNFFLPESWCWLLWRIPKIRWSFGSWRTSCPQLWR